MAAAGLAGMPRARGSEAVCVQKEAMTVPTPSPL